MKRAVAIFIVASVLVVLVVVLFLSGCYKPKPESSAKEQRKGKELQATVESNIEIKKEVVSLVAMEQRVDSLVKKLDLRKRPKDEFDEHYTIHSKFSKDHVDCTQAIAYIMVLPKLPCYVLHLRLQYYADDRLFIQSYKIKADSMVFTLIPSNGVKTDNGGGNIWEWADCVISSKDSPDWTKEGSPSTDLSLADLQQIADAKTVKLRSVGQRCYDDRNLSAQELKGLRDVLRLYNEIK